MTYTKRAFLSLLVGSFVTLGSVAHAWEVDMSRRQNDFDRIQNQSRLPASSTESEPVGLISQILESAGPTQDIVILNTEKGFVPETVYMKKGGNYKLHVVNVNPKDKNVSFVLDAFSEHHNTLFGQERSFTVSPKTDGVFTYQCPETAVQGKIVILASPSDQQRQPASVNSGM